MRWIPDWLLYLAVLGVVLLVIFRNDEFANAPEVPPPSPLERVGGFLPAPSAADATVLVEVPAIAPSTGTAFSVDEAGVWLTARHVVDGCTQIGLIMGPGAAASVIEAYIDTEEDIAMLVTDGAPKGVSMVPPDTQLRLGQQAFHIGYPQGRPGEATSRLMGRERLVARGRYDQDMTVLAWAEVGRTTGLAGSLAGLSGGPAMDSKGRVLGVTIAEQPRRGRIYTASPAAMVRLLNAHGAGAASGEPSSPLSSRTYGKVADELRRSVQVAKVICLTE